MKGLQRKKQRRNNILKSFSAARCFFRTIITPWYFYLLLARWKFLFFPRKGNVNIKKFLRLRNSTGWINVKYRRKTVKEIKGNTSCSLQRSKEKIKLFIWLNRFPSYVIGFQRRFGGMRDESKNGGGMQDDRNFNNGMQYIKKNKL